MPSKDASVVLEIDRRTIIVRHPRKILWPEQGLTKLDLVDYYVRVAPYILPHLKDRPLTLKPYSQGIHGAFFYAHNAPKGTPDWIKTTTFEPLTARGKIIHPILANDAATLAWLASRAVIETHTWLSREDRPASPDTIVFDLDPGKRVSFAVVLEVALDIRNTLDKIGLRSWFKTSGATGAHVYVPVDRRYTFDQTRHFAEKIAKTLSAKHPIQVAHTLTDPRLDDKVMIDYAQNSIGKTMASVYSVRPLAAAPVSMPFTWEEVERGGFMPHQYTIKNVFERLKQTGDIFRPTVELKQIVPNDAI